MRADPPRAKARTCSRVAIVVSLIALIEQAAAIERILRHLGLPAGIPDPCSARAPPLPYDMDPSAMADDVTACDPSSCGSHTASRSAGGVPGDARPHRGPLAR